MQITTKPRVIELKSVMVEKDLSGTLRQFVVMEIKDGDARQNFNMEVGDVLTIQQTVVLSFLDGLKLLLRGWVGVGAVEVRK